MIALVPGAWHTPEHYSELVDYIKKEGYDVLCRRNPSCDASNADEATTQEDSEAIRNNVLLPLIEMGKDVILVMHSYGGSPGSAAAKGLSKTERTASGKEGGIIGLIFVAAFLAGEGESLVSKLPDQKFESWYDQLVSLQALIV